MAAFALGGCGIIDPGDDGAERELRQARALWAAAAIDDYDLRQRRRCFCVDPGLVRVEVRDGIRVATVLVDDDGSSPLHPQHVADYPTVDELFGLVARAIEGDVDELRVTYHPVLGYPVDVWVDRSFAIADEEFGYATELVAPSSGG